MPHRLYGHVDAAENYSVGALAARRRARCSTSSRARAALPILVGGTGLYFKALTQGLAAVPPIPAEIRAAVRGAAATRGRRARCYAELLRARSGDRARGSMPSDRSRIARALEVVRRPAARWPTGTATACRRCSIRRARRRCSSTCERAELVRRIEARFDAMLEAGALDEVRALAARKLDPMLPAMKAHGVPWLIRHLDGEISLDEAAARRQAWTPAATPSARSPGSATRCRTGRWCRAERRGRDRRHALARADVPA